MKKPNLHPDEPTRGAEAIAPRPGEGESSVAAARTRRGAASVVLKEIAAGVVSLAVVTAAMGAEYLTPNDVVLPSETASQETVAQSAGKASLRFAGWDVFPHAAAAGMFDDNVLITHTNPLSDLEWTLSPGVTMEAGDVSTAFLGSVTLEQLRDLLTYSLVDDDAKPQRFVGVDFTPGINLFTDHSEFNNVDYTAGLTASYAFSKLALELDQDYSRLAVKDNEVGSRITRIFYETKLRSRYQLTDRTAFEVDGRYRVQDFADAIYHGYKEYRNEDWVDRRVGGKLDLGVGAAFGFVYPVQNADQTYQQALVRGIYQISGKLDARASLGVEMREYGGGIRGTLDPVFNFALIYQFRPMTTFTVEAHRQDQPSPEGYYNYKTLGLSGGARQKMFGRLSASLCVGYDAVDYVRLRPVAAPNRFDSYYSLCAGLQYDINQRWTASLFYIFQGDASNTERYTYADDMVGVRVGWRY